MKYAFLGAGKMASAIICGMLDAKVCAAADITASCPEPELLENLRTATSIHIAASNAEAASSAPVVVLCVKPDDVGTALAQAGTSLDG